MHNNHLTPDENIQIMDFEESFEAYSVVEVVGGSQCAYLFLDPNKSAEENCDLFLKHQQTLAATLIYVQSKYLRLCFEYFFIALEKEKMCLPVSWTQYFRNFCMKVRREIKDYSKSYLLEAANKYSLDSHDFRKLSEKNSKRIENQARSMNYCVWICAATVLVIFRDVIKKQPNNLSMELEYQVSEPILELFTSNSIFMTTLSLSAENDMKELAKICRMMKENNSQRTQFGNSLNTRQHEERVPRKCYKGMSVEVGAKRKEMSLTSTKLQSTSKKLKHSDVDEVKSLDAAQVDVENSMLLLDIFRDDASSMSVQSSPEDKVGVQASLEDKVGVQASLEDKVGVQASPEDKVGVQASLEDKVGVQSSPEDKVGVQASPEDKVGVQASFEDKVGVQASSEDMVGVQASSESLTFTSFHTCSDIDDEVEIVTSNGHSESRQNVTELDPCIQWFQGMENCVAGEGDLRIKVQWVEQLLRYSPASVIARFDNVRKAFLSTIQTSFTISSIENFIETHAYIQLQVKYDKTLYSETKPDGLCCMRSLKQLRDAASIDFNMKGKRKRDQSNDWGDLDVKLEIEDSREGFKTFLTDLIKALKFITFERCSKKGGDFTDKVFYSDLKNKWISVLQSTYDQIENFNDSWESFSLNKEFWTGWFVLKIIPHAFSNEFLSFPGSYFCSNEDDAGKHYRTGGDWKEYGVLLCSLQHSTTDITFGDPLSLQFKNIKQVLKEKKMIYSGSHFFAIRQHSDEINETHLKSCVRNLANQIYSYISRTTVPQLPCLSDVDTNNHSQQESNEIATRENLITKERYKQLMFEKDAEIRRLKEEKDAEIRRLKEELSKYRNLDEAGSSGK